MRFPACLAEERKRLPPNPFEAIALRLAEGSAGRSEATIQSEIRALFRALPRGLSDEDFIADLEVPVPGGGRLDLRIDDLIIEVKKSLANPTVLREAIEQVERYLAAFSEVIDGARVAILTDGQLWLEFSRDKDGLVCETGRLSAPAWVNDPDVLVLATWLLEVYDRAHADKVHATAKNVIRILGAGSTSHEAVRTRLGNLFAGCCNVPEVRLKRELWAKLLTTALGTNFPDDDELFLDHTMLVIMAELIAHAVLGFDITRADIDTNALLNGTYFAESGVRGVVEADFFDWPVLTDGGSDWIRSMARRVARVDWTAHVEHDVLKALYEGIISPEQRRSLGEYYTPDWLAEGVVKATVSNPLEQRVHDPSCGSGTFVFHAVRLYLDAAAEAGQPTRAAIEGVARHVSGIDVHPVAVTLARVTYLLALGAENLRMNRPPALAIPVHLGDSVQWQNDPSILTSHDLVIETSDGLELLADELRFPLALVADVETFDETVATLASRANDDNRDHGQVPAITRIVDRLDLDPGDKETLLTTFRRMCQLVDHGRDHIWGYYVRNLARPLRLSLREHRVDCLIGNPPWLTFNAMTADMKVTFRRMCNERNLWTGTARNHDLASFFVARCVELYLLDGGSFAFVMPAATLNRRPASGFRAANWSTLTGSNDVKFDMPWDMTHVAPSIFPVPSCVVFGTRSDEASSLPESKMVYRGILPVGGGDWLTATAALDSQPEENIIPSDPRSEYVAAFEAGAKLDPRVLVLAERIDGGGVLGPRVGATRVRSRRSLHAPWRNVDLVEANVEDQFIRQALLGESIGSFRVFDPCFAVIPWLDGRLIGTHDEAISEFPGLESWQTPVERAWAQNRLNESQPWLARLDYQRRLSRQLRVERGDLVVYPKSGSVLIAARVPAGSIIDQKLYAAAVSNVEEAQYLCGILNAPITTRLTGPFQSAGQFGTRDFDLYPFQLPIPPFFPGDNLHVDICAVASEAEQIAAAVEFTTNNWQQRRAALQRELKEKGIHARLDTLVAQLLSGRDDLIDRLISRLASTD